MPVTAFHDFFFDNMEPYCLYLPETRNVNVVRDRHSAKFVIELKLLIRNTRYPTGARLTGICLPIDAVIKSTKSADRISH